MPPKRGNAKAKAESVANAEADSGVEVASKKKGGKAAKVVEEKPEDDVANNGDEDTAKNGTSKRGKKAKDVGNGESKLDEAEVEASTEVAVPTEDEPKVPAKRGRKAKEPQADKQPANKKVKSSEESQAESNVDNEEEEPEAAQKPRRGRKAAEKKEPETKSTKNAKAKKGKDLEEAGDEEEAQDDVSEEAEAEVKAPAKRGRGAPKKAASKEDPEEKEEPAEKVPAKKRGAKAEDEPPAKKKSAKPLLNKTVTDYSSIDFSCSKTTPSGKPWNFKISSWNVDGIRAWLNKGGLDYINYEKPDILCLQEIKCSQEKLPEEISSVPGYHPYWLSTDKEGYAGVGIYTKKMAIHVTYGLGDASLDSEGRIITAEYEQFFLICTYVPNAGRGLVTLPKRLQWNDIFRKYVKSLDAKKPVIICGDMNVSHLEIDLTNPKTNKKNAGFTPEEREGMTDLLNDGFVDTFRKLYPDKTGSYTFWTYMMNCRAKNVGWRLDYALVSERLMPAVCDNIIRSQVFGSDHCPITLFLHLNGIEQLSDTIEN